LSVVFETKLALFEALKLRFGGGPMKTLVTWADPADKAFSRSVWFTESTEPELEAVALVAGRRKPTNLTAELTIRAVAVAPGDPINAERAVYQLRAEIEKAVLDDFTPDAVPGLVDVRPIRATVTNGESPSGTAAMCDFTVRVRARIHS